MKVALQLRQSQHLTLTPQLQQAIKLLQLSTLEINQEAARLLDENPFLETEDENVPQIYQHGESSVITNAQTSSNDQASNDTDWANLNFSAPSNSDEDDDYQREVVAEQPNLREHLLWELNVSSLTDRDKKIISLLIDALDENAYLSQPLTEIAELIPAELDVTLDDLETALVQLQHLDEPGIAARDLSECLALQLQAFPEDLAGRNLALQIVTQHLDLLAIHDFSKLKKLLQCDDESLRCAQDLIVHLQPKPGACFEQRSADYVVPDVIVEKQNGHWQARLNQDAMPRLRINQIYANILQQRNENYGEQMALQLQEARWFIKNLHQRFETILRVSQAIVNEQIQFFEHGDIAMRPLVLREIAEQLELHESTISRVTTQKFIQTPNGIYELKHFFGSGLSTENGGTCSSTAIRALIKQLIGEEDTQRPLSDSNIAEILEQRGILVARRTVAKYRELMNILPVNLRKSL